MKIGNKIIGSGRTYIIAEFGVNHNGSLERAKEGIIKAAQAGADAIKFQTYTADELVVKGTPKFWDAESKVDEGLDQHEAYKALEGFKNEWYPELLKCCEENNIEFLSTPFSIEAANFLNALGMKAFKVASSDMSTLPYLRHIAKFDKPILLSTGASTMIEIDDAILAMSEAGNDDVVILHCMLKYPTPDEHANLATIRRLYSLYPLNEIGISDHTLGVFPSLIAIANGATVVEKHFTVDKTLDKSADHWLSIDPTELKELVDGARRIESLMGVARENTWFEVENETRKYDKRSIVSAVDIPAGTAITEEMLTYKRPGTGIWPEQLSDVIGNKALDLIPADTTLTWELFQ